MKNVLVTGSTTGIGFATALLFAEKGHNVILNGITELGEEEVKKLDATSGSYEFLLFDVTDENAVNENVAKIAEKHGKLDVLVNCAGGLGGRSRFEEMTTEFYRKVMALNLDSVFFVTRACIPLLKKGTDAAVINFTSIAGWNSGGPGAGIYGTSKAAVTTLTRALAKDLAEFGIKVNAVSPGTIDTPFHQATKDANPELFQSWKNNILMKRFGDAREVATVVEFLATEGSSFLTGETIQINGGQAFI